MSNKYKPVPFVETSYDKLFADGQYDEAISFMKQFILEHENNPYAEMIAQINIASCYYCLGKIDSAFEHTLAYKQLCTKYGNQQDHYNLCHISALIYEFDQNYHKAEAAAWECIQIASNLHLQHELAESYNLYSNIKILRGHFEEGLKYALLAQELTYTQNPENLFLVCQIHCNIASAYIRTGRYSEAHNILLLLSNNPYTHSNSRERSIFLYFQGILQVKERNLVEAIPLFKEARSIAESSNDLPMLRRLIWDLAHAYEEMNDFEEAFNCMRFYGVLSNELIARRSSSNVADLSLLHSVALMEQRANIDHLSGVYNRNYLETTCNEWLKTAKLTNDHICCIAFDVDNFKLINDNYGHLVGDEVIKQLGETCLNMIKDDNEIIGRYGGDEFVIILKNFTIEEVEAKSRQYFEALSSIAIMHEQYEISITVSMGIICNSSIIANKFTQLFKVADQALYMAKKQGKNQIVTLSNNCAV